MPEEVNGNYIKLYRSLRDPGCWIRKRPEWLGIWVDILLKAAWTKYGYLQRGELYWEPEIDWPNLPRWVVNEFMRQARKEKELICRKPRRGPTTLPTIYFVVNYDKYQGNGNGLPVNSPVNSPVNPPLNYSGKADDTTDSGCHKKERKKERNTSASQNGEFKEVTDYIWRTYEEKYGVNPPSDKAFFTNLAKLLKQYGKSRITHAWELYLSSDEEFYTKQAHSPRTFTASAVILRFLVTTDDHWVDELDKRIVRAPQ